MNDHRVGDSDLDKRSRDRGLGFSDILFRLQWSVNAQQSFKILPCCQYVWNNIKAWKYQEATYLLETIGHGFSNVLVNRRRYPLNTSTTS